MKKKKKQVEKVISNTKPWKKWAMVCAIGHDQNGKHISESSQNSWWYWKKCEWKKFQYSKKKMDKNGTHNTTLVICWEYRNESGYAFLMYNFWNFREKT